MPRCLILGSSQPIAQLVSEQLPGFEVVRFSEIATDDAEFHGDARKAATYIEAIQNIDVIYSDFIGMDVDWKIEAVFETLRQAGKQVRTVMRSVAGVDGEVIGGLHYPEITDTEEFLKQQRYAIKIVDEAEMPYTILRPIIDDNGSTAVTLINEGLPVPAKPITSAAFAKVAAAEIVHGKHLNQSIAVIGK